MRRIVSHCFTVACWLVLLCLWHNRVTAQPTLATGTPAPVAKAVSLIRQQRFAEAVSQLEEFLEKNPNQPEALSYLAAARLYVERDYLKAKQYFADALKAGGSAAFYVDHSHEMAFLSTDELTDYCRGWLHLRPDGVTFVPDEGAHGFRYDYREIAECKQNRGSGRLFHITKQEQKEKEKEKANYNFRPRTRTAEEVLLIVVMYQKLAGAPARR